MSYRKYQNDKALLSKHLNSKVRYRFRNYTYAEFFKLVDWRGSNYKYNLDMLAYYEYWRDAKMSNNLNVIMFKTYDDIARYDSVTELFVLPKYSKDYWRSIAQLVFNPYSDEFIRVHAEIMFHPNRVERLYRQGINPEDL